MSLVLLPYMYVPDPTRGRPVFDGKIYIGDPDTNPRLPENQKSALLVQEDGSVVEAAYPIATNSGGVPTYDGSPVAIDVVGEYSLAIDDRNDNQVYYFPNAGSILEFITTDLRSIMFDLCLEYDDIGSVIVTDVEGTDLDGAEWILDIETGAVWRVPPDVPAGSTVVSLVDNILTTNNGQFTLTVTKCPVAPNKIKTSQFVVEGTTGDPLPSTTPTSYLSGAEMALGWVVTTDVVDAIIDANGNLTATSGVVEYTFDKADNGTPNAASLFASVMHCTDAANSVYVQDYADGSNGISITETATTVTMVIDFSDFAGGKVFGVSERLGRLSIDSTEDIRRYAPTQLAFGSFQNGATISLSESLFKFKKINVIGDVNVGTSTFWQAEYDTTNLSVGDVLFITENTSTQAMSCSITITSETQLNVTIANTSWISSVSFISGEV